MASHDFSEFEGVELEPPHMPDGHTWGEIPRSPRRTPSEIILRNFYKGQHRDLEDAFGQSPAPIKQQNHWWSMSREETKTVLVELYGWQWKLVRTQTFETMMRFSPSTHLRALALTHHTSEVRTTYSLQLVMEQPPIHIAKAILASKTPAPHRQEGSGQTFFWARQHLWDGLDVMLTDIWDNNVLVDMVPLSPGINLSEFEYLYHNTSAYDFSIRHRPGRSPKNPQKRVFDGSDYLTKERPEAKKPSDVLSRLMKRVQHKPPSATAALSTALLGMVQRMQIVPRLHQTPK